MNKKAFTLIELLVVIMIMGVLASLISGNFFTSLKKGRDTRRKGDLEQIQRSLELYYEDNKAYPTQIPAGINSKGFIFGYGFPKEGGQYYMTKVPDDPIASKHYKYETDATGSYFKLYACLENNQQILPYISSPGSFSCDNAKYPCFKPDNTPTTAGCIWGISSPNTNP